MPEAIMFIDLLAKGSPVVLAAIIVAILRGWLRPEREVKRLEADCLAEKQNSIFWRDLYLNERGMLQEAVQAGHTIAQVASRKQQ